MTERKSQRKYNIKSQQQESVFLKIEEVFSEFNDESTKIFISNFGQPNLDVKLKRDNDFSTPADTEIESSFIKWVTRNFPEHEVYGEEYGFQKKRHHEWLWAIDPIDGTTNYKNGNPNCGIVVSLRHENLPIFSHVKFPIRNEVFKTYLAKGATLNGQLITPPLQRDLKLALVSVNYLNRPKRMMTMVEKFWDEVGGIHMEMCSLSEACDVITGKLSAALLYELGPHEWPAVYALADGAGCVIEPLGNPESIFSIEGTENRSLILGSSKSIVNKLNRLVNLPPKLKP